MKMETVAQVTALCVVAALLALVLKRGTPELGLLLTLAAVTAVLLALLGTLGEVVQFLDELAQRSGVSPALFEPLYKTIGIAVVVKTGGSLCRDAGETALAGAVETAGAVCALLVTLPLLRRVLSLLLELMV